MHTWATGVPATSSTGTTLSGLCGLATSGPSSPRSISTRSSYSAPSSGPTSEKSSSRCWRRSQSRVSSSGGKTAEVAPSSAIMFAMVPRSGIDRSAVPGPVNSKTLFLPPLAESRRSSSRMMSLACTHGRASSPSSRTSTTSGQAISYGWPAMATATSRPPAPIAIMPSAPLVVVCESAPMRMSPGRAKRARHTTVVSAAATLSEAIAPLRADPARAAVLLDIDGVLAPIVRHAEDAHVPEPTRAPLIAVAKRYGLVACVSGRQATTARRIVSLGSITYVGNHGAELLRGGKTDVELDPEVAKWAPQIREFAEEAWSDDLRRLRVRAEDKDVIRAFHWRGAPDEDAAAAAIRDIARRAEEAGLVTHWGRKVLEIRPPVELNKGRGVRRLVEETPIEAAAYVGDDTTDLDAFAALRALVEEERLRHAVCIGVR